TAATWNTTPDAVLVKWGEIIGGAFVAYPGETGTSYLIPATGAEGKVHAVEVQGQDARGRLTPPVRSNT
ncbi:hypothetical protein, partial [Citrobacter koseri]|uniref:hypothetical protein n=1 Tax=Citrobacter koseri TaxID=545 RepID=UPI0024B85EE5